MDLISPDTPEQDFPPFHKTIIVHCAEGWLGPVTDGAFDFFTKLEQHAFSLGWQLLSVAEGSAASQALVDRGGRHLVIGGHARYRPGLLHVAPAYLWGFWYLDPLGTYWQSSIALSDFPKDEISWEAAQYFFDGVTSHMLENNISKRPQPDREGLSAAFATVFCQRIERHWPRSHYLTTEEIIRNTARAAGGGRVYVKPHPDDAPDDVRRIMALCDGDPNLILSDRSIHDLVHASAAVVTQNSAAGFEALMQHKPIVLCAKADFHHATVTARSEDDLRAILRDVGGQTRNVDYHRYLTWFLKHRCLEPQAEDFETRAWTTIMRSVVD